MTFIKLIELTADCLKNNNNILSDHKGQHTRGLCSVNTFTQSQIYHIYYPLPLIIFNVVQLQERKHINLLLGDKTGLLLYAKILESKWQCVNNFVADCM